MPLPQILQEQIDAGFVEQEAMRWVPGTWRRWIGDLDGVGAVLDALPSAVNRRDAASAARDALDQGNVVGAFCAVMVWGYGNSGRGPFKVDRILRGAEAFDRATITSRLVQALELVRSAGPVEAYRFLYNADRGAIKYLGPAFFTKWLSLAAFEDPYGPDAPPILDSLVREWVTREAGVSLPKTRTVDYETYIKLLEGWAASTGCTQTQLESTVFRLERARRSGPGVA